MQDDKMLKNWRGRRLLACRAADELERIINHIGIEDGSELPPSDGGLPKINEGQRNELLNATALVLRLVLGANDGNVSPARLRRY